MVEVRAVTCVIIVGVMASHNKTAQGKSWWLGHGVGNGELSHSVA
jgi:hypothetical protein